MEDLTSMLPGDPITALAPTSQAGGNQIFSNELGMTAPGSQPASPARSITGETIDHAPPVIEASGSKIPTGTDGMPKARDNKDWSPPGPPSWTAPPAHSN